MPAGLTRAQFWGCLAIAVAVFLFATGPVWRDPLHIDGAVYASYLVIPALVVAVLAWSRRLSWRNALAATFELALLKFAITAAIATATWAVANPEPVVPGWIPPPQVAEPSLAGPPPPTPFEPAVDVTGRVIDASGAPVAGALVYVAGGLEGMSFAPPAAAVELAVGGDGFEPPVLAVQTWQPITLRSRSDALHTAIGRADDRQVFNVAVPAGGVRTLTLHEATGVVELGCGVHEEPHQQPPAVLAVLHHPFFAITGPDGAFALRGLPDVDVELAAHHPAGELRVIRSAQ